MKYHEYMEKLEETSKNYSKDKNGNSLTEMIGDILDIWSNDACKGYLKIALKQFDELHPGMLNDEAKADLFACMKDSFNWYSVDKAEDFTKITEEKDYEIIK